MSNFRYTSFFTGNIFKEESDRFMTQMNGIFNDRTNDVVIERREFDVINYSGRSIIVPLVSESNDEQDVNGATMNYYLIGSRDERNKAIIDLIKHKFRNDAYEYLRTELQLGYVVLAGFTFIGCQDSA